MTITWATGPLCKVLPLIGFSDVHLDGGKVDTGSMNKERADKLIAAGTVEKKNTVVIKNRKTWDKKLETYLELRGKKDPYALSPK